MIEFTTTYYQQNRKRLISSLPKQGIVVVAGNGRMQRSADITFPFRQDSSLFYLTGISEPCVTLIINSLTGQEWLMVERREGVKAIFDGAIDDSKLRSISGISTIVSDTEGWQIIKAIKSDVWYATNNIASKIDDMYTNPHRLRVAKKLSRTTKQPITSLQPYLATLRAIKQPLELAAINKAITITNSAVQTISQNLHTFKNEHDIATRLHELFVQGEADGHAFDPIVASADASCTLHYTANNQPLIKESVLLLDVGAEYLGYAADVSRTIYYGEQKNNRQQAVMQAVASAQKEIINFIKPGLTWRQLNDYANNVVAKQLVALGLMTSVNDTDTLKTYFPHAISHFMGLDVHDVGDYSAPLQAGMVITVEPGIYIKQESFGVRIEDDILITHSGAEIMGNSLPSLL